MVEDRPPWRAGKICYIEIPAVDAARSAEFYSQAFGWQMRTGLDGATAFDDTVGEVSGTFVTGRPAAQPGFLIYIMVADAEATLAAITAAGGEPGHLEGPAAGEVFARFRDPRRQRPGHLPAARPRPESGTRPDAERGGA